MKRHQLLQGLPLQGLGVMALLTCMEPRTISPADIRQSVRLQIDASNLSLVPSQASFSLQIKGAQAEQSSAWKKEFKGDLKSWPPEGFELEEKAEGPVKIRLELRDHNQFLISHADLETDLNQSTEAKALNLVSSTDEERLSRVDVFVQAKSPTAIEDSAIDDALSFKDVRDIFNRYNCVVCHSDEKTFNLGLYPFPSQRFQEDPQQLAELIRRQVIGKKMPPKGLAPIKAADLERLVAWIDAGARSDPRSPLIMSAQPKVEGTLNISYEVVGSENLRGRFALSESDSQQSLYHGLLDKLPRGAQWQLKLEFTNHQNQVIKEQDLGTWTIGEPQRLLWELLLP